MLLFTGILLFTECSEKDEGEIIVENKEPEKECLINIDTIDFTFGIDYADPGKYLVPGEQSDLADYLVDHVSSIMGPPADSISYVLRVCDWINRTFSFENAGGAMMGVNTVDELYAIKKFYGCHSAALIISSTLRELGFPAVMIETASVKWAYEYRAGNAQYFVGHVMSEIFVEGKWVLLDNNGTWVENYDPQNPFIPVRKHPTPSYFVYAKGTDVWDYTGRDEEFTHREMVFFSDNIFCFEEMLNTVNYSWNS